EKVLHREPPGPRQVAPALPADVEAVILKAMDKQPARRYATAKEVADELDRCLRNEPVAARRSAFTRRIRAGMRRNPWLAWAGAGLVLAAIGASAWRSVADSNAAAAAARERDREIKGAADLARLSIDAMLTLRRAGANEGMKEFLGRIESAVDESRRKGYWTAELESLLGAAYRAAMMNRKALECQDRALAASPTLAPAAYERLALLRGDPTLPGALAGAGVTAALRTLPEGPERRFVSACTALDSKNEAAARQELEKAVSADPYRVEAWELLARVEGGAPASTVKEKEDRVRRAEEVLTRALRSDRGYVPFWLDRGRLRRDFAGILGEGGKDPTLLYQGADEDYTEALRLQPSVGAFVGRAQTRTLQARHHASLGENPQKGFEEAAADLDQAARLNERDASVLVGRSLALRTRADYGVARGESPLRDLEQLEARIADFSKSSPVPAEAWANYAMIWADQALYRSGLGEDPSADFARAEDAFAKIQDPGPAPWREQR
ncbi:MAG TPA: hypothetical protein VKW77_00965, partial [Acidimicrobiales bacterium]|nr:hypothetical protein [Acidimicrobiales bacterium]